MSAQDKFGVVGENPQISTAALSEIWLSKEPLPTLSRTQTFWYYIQRGINTLTALPMSSMITIMTITISLFVFAGFLLLLSNVDHVLSSAGNTSYVTVYLKSDTSPERATELFDSLQKHPLVKSADFVSSEQAMELLKQDLGERSGVLEGLDNENPLPVSIDLQLHHDELGHDQNTKFVGDVRTREGVDQVIQGSEWVERVHNAVRVFRFLASVGLVLALFVVIFLISNTIKLAIYARSDELMVMQLVGASRSFIQIPFVVAGIVQGFFGALLAVVMLDGAFILLNIELQKLVMFGISIPGLVFLSPLTIGGVVIFGIGVGVVGSILALNKFMDA